MAGERAANNAEGRSSSSSGGGSEARTGTTMVEGLVAVARGEPHSRVGGILECDPAAAAAAAPGNSTGKSTDEQQEQQPAAAVVDGLCRYAAGATSGGMSFVEVCQVKERERERGELLYICI